MGDNLNRGHRFTPGSQSTGCSAFLVITAVVMLAAIGAWWLYGSFPKPGQQFILTAHPPERVVVVLASKDAAMDFAKFRAAGDNFGLKQLFAKGKVLKVPWGAKVLIIDHDWQHSLYEVRVLDGPFSGERGWVLRDNLGAISKRPSGATTR